VDGTRGSGDFFGFCSELYRAVAVRFEQKLTLSGARERVPRRTYILATGWSSPLEKFARRFDQDPTWAVKRVDCGHLIMLDRPDKLTDLLVAAA